MNEKRCLDCRNIKSILEFGKDKNTKDGKNTRCKTCRNKASKVFRKNNPDKVKNNNDRLAKNRKDYYNNPERKYKYKSKYLYTRYGITMEDFDKLLDSQNGVCAICKNEETSVRNNSLAVDHCHKTGKVRGLLCSHCNRALGLFKDNINNLKETIKYLEKQEKENEIK